MQVWFKMGEIVFISKHVLVEYMLFFTVMVVSTERGNGGCSHLRWPNIRAAQCLPAYNTPFLFAVTRIDTTAANFNPFRIQVPVLSSETVLCW